MLEEASLALQQVPVVPADIAALDLSDLVHEYGATLFRVAHAVLRNRAEAEDAVQDALVRVLEHRRDLPTVRDLRPWLVRITWNCALDRRRRKRPEQAEELFLQSLAAPGASLEATLVEAEQSRRMLEAIDRLPGAERQALLLSALQEIPTREVATAMGKSESAVRSLLHRARTRLAERLSRQLTKGGAR